MRSKKFVIIYAVVIFLIVFLITFNSVCSISQFEIRFEAGSTEMQTSAENIQARLDDEYLKKNFLFFKESTITSVVAEESGGYLEVTEIEKHFPNRITVRIREKYECYAFVKDGKYYVIGDDGTVLAMKDQNVNNIAGRNVEIAGFQFEEPAVGEVFSVSARQSQAYDALLALFEQIEAAQMRGNISKIEYYDMGVSDPQKNFTYFYIDCIEGLRIRIVKPEQNAEAKAKLTVSSYLSGDAEGGGFGDAERTYGYITIQESGGAVTSVYSQEKPNDWIA